MCGIIYVLGLFALASAAEPPKWPTAYKVAGTIKLPYAEVEEPFSAYFDGPNNRSRVDYYNETVITIQLGYVAKSPKQFGGNYKVAPVFMNGKNDRKCFLVNGTADSPVVAQSALPDLTGFKNIGQDQMFGKACSVWQLVKLLGQKKNTYTMWMSTDNQPVRYEMMGYDTLLGSHYDKYYVDYSAMTPANFSNSDFKPPQGMSCGDFPGPGNSDHRITMNPMMEYINHYDSHTNDMFNHFKKTHKKHYRDSDEHSHRLHLFRQNLRFIHSKNRAGLTYSLAVNHLADLDDKEMSFLRGYKHSGKPDPNAIPFNKYMYDLDSTPSSVDWRLYGAVTPVKDQAMCGSCWSFGTTGAVEGALFMKTGSLVRLSQQELMDCSWDQGNNACDGGEDFRAYQWIQKHGLATEEEYGPYLAQDGYCHAMNTSSRANIKGYVNVTSGDGEALKVAMANNGPISVGIDASHKSLSFYANGVYYDKDCGNTPDDLDHAVLAVGYGVINGQSYWLVKNSWSTYWGNAGYVLMSQEANNCGVETSPTYVII